MAIRRTAGNAQDVRRPRVARIAGQIAAVALFAGGMLGVYRNILDRTSVPAPETAATKQRWPTSAGPSTSLPRRGERRVKTAPPFVPRPLEE